MSTAPSTPRHLGPRAGRRLVLADRPAKHELVSLSGRAPGRAIYELGMREPELDVACAARCAQARRRHGNAVSRDWLAQARLARIRRATCGDHDGRSPAGADGCRRRDTVE